MDRLQASQLVHMVSAAFPQRGVSDETVDVYVALLEGLPFEETRVAVLELIATSKFFPAIAEIRRAVALGAVPYDTATVAWDRVMETVRRYGRYFGPRWGNDAQAAWDEPTTRAVAACGGYEAICACPLERLSAMCSRFRQVYDEIVERQVRQVQTGDLALGRDELIMLDPGGSR